jgi:protein TonB
MACAPLPLPPTARRTAHALAGAALALFLAAPAAAQPAPESCPSRLAAARGSYQAQRFDAAEELLRDCLDRRGLPPEEMTEGYRLLALIYLRQDLLREAQETVLKHLAWSFDYEPDEIQDPPLYVALVRAVKQQLEVPPTLLASVGPAGVTAPVPAPERPDPALSGQADGQAGIGLVHPMEAGAERPFRYADAAESEDAGGVSERAGFTSSPGGVTGLLPPVLDFATVMPELLNGPLQPEYPALEHRTGVGGRVFLRFVVNEDGTVGDVEVVRGVNPGLDHAAAEAIRRARFSPGRQNGQPVRVRTALAVHFRAH